METKGGPRKIRESGKKTANALGEEIRDGKKHKSYAQYPRGMPGKIRGWACVAGCEFEEGEGGEKGAGKAEGCGGWTCRFQNSLVSISMT